MTNKIWNAIKYLDFAPESQGGGSSELPSPPRGDDQERSGGAIVPPEFLDWQQRRLNLVCGELERRCTEIERLRRLAAEEHTAARLWMLATIVSAGLGVLGIWLAT